MPSGPDQTSVGDRRRYPGTIAEIGPLLIANRGEIAVRIARTAHGLGLRTVGVFTEPDADALHVDTVDEAIRVASYLDIEAIVEAAAKTGAAAVHPGYGFLSENAAFARAVQAAGLTWVGPPPEAIELMGDKGAAKAAAQRAGVPIVPAGDDGVYPVVVKALAGGGGKGMRVVHAESELADATAAAKREAMAAFGDDRVMIERWIERPRHIEVQVLADAHGNVVHLGERECSLQRRHQKVVEEAPSPVVTPALRAKLGAAAVALATQAGYEGAGTVEFITPHDASEFFFLEMNTRLQVEHPVTELVYGVDLVELQLRGAAGEQLPFGQAQMTPRGHAVEARLYAEDPAAGFLPATGRVRHLTAPPDARFDSGVREGSEITTSFDPMLAKVIAHGTDRAQALDKLDRALAELELLGVATNAAFTRALLARPDIRAGDQDTGLLERILAESAVGDSPPVDLLPVDLLPAGALAAAGTSRPAGPWRRRFEHGEVRIEDGTVTIDGHRQRAEVRRIDARHVAVELDGTLRRYAVVVDEDGELWVARDGHHLDARPVRIDRSAAALPAGSLEAPMPGTVLQVRVENGDQVTEGDVLLVLESMKMELQVTAPHAGVVEGLSLAPGDRVELKQPLVAVSAP
ncbi:MAG TPA: biotin carboxylase N-terminal domain-containing protein [Solirubrobacteraceae bacterium]|nr:biotin carboxylase N-terminal domain-containing protein [Solirubrobacteraceae bacterium]